MAKSYHVADKLYPVNAPLNNTFYFSKLGSSTNDGRTIETPLSSPNECITKINALTGGDVPAANNLYAVVCLDGGLYVIDDAVNYTDPLTNLPTVNTAKILTIPGYVEIYAPNATFQGLILQERFSRVCLGTSMCETDGIVAEGTEWFIKGSNFMIPNLGYTGDSPACVECKNVQTRGAAFANFDGSARYQVKFNKVYCNAPETPSATKYSCAIGNSEQGTMFAAMNVDGLEVTLNGDYSTAVACDKTVILRIRINSIYELSGTNTFGFNLEGLTTCQSYVGNINADTAIWVNNSGGSATLNLYASKVNGSIAANGSGANGVLNLVDLSGDSILHGTIQIDNIKVSGNSITSEDTNGDISLTPNGTGEVNITKVDIDAGAIDGTTLGGASAVTITNATIVTVDNITIDGDSITDATNDLTIEASGATKDLVLKAATDVLLDPASNNNPKVDIAGTEYTMPYTVPVQAFSTVGNVGDANQFLAGYTGWSIAELENFFGSGKIYSYNKFATGALGTDTNGAYDYTMGAAAKAPSDGIGIEGVAGTAISFDGGDYATNATKLDNFNTIFSGAGKGFIHSFWVIAPSDGQPAATARLFNKTNSAANDKYVPALDTNGTIYAAVRGNSATTIQINSTTALPNGANGIWTHVVICWDSTYGLRLFINGVNEATNSTATTLMVDGTTTDFYIGGSDATPTDPFTGRIVQEIIINKVAEQRDIDILFARTRPEPAVLAGKEYTVMAKVQPEGNTKYEYQENAPVLAKYAGKIFIDGRAWGEADKVKLEAIVL